MWNYVYFLIYLEKKPADEYTGIEQYVAELAKKQYITFFPTLRSKTLERAEAGDTQESEQTTVELQEQNMAQNLQSALISHKKFSSNMAKDDEIVNSLLSSSKHHNHKKREEEANMTSLDFI